MKKLLSLIKMEAQTRTPFPIIEFIQLLIFSSLYYRIFFVSSSASTHLDEFRISSIFDVSMTWSYALNMTFLITGIILAVFVSMTFASEYESGLMLTKLALPIERSEYLLSKLVYYILLMFATLGLSYGLILFLNPLQISQLRLIQIIGITISQIALLTILPMFFAILTRKNNLSILLTLTIEVMVFLMFSNGPTPIGYYFSPSRILTSNNHIEGFIWGIILPLLTSFFLFVLTFIKFSEMDITHGDD